MHWPMWLLKGNFKGKLPATAKRMRWDDQDGILLDSKYGQPTGTTMIRDKMAEGIEMEEVVLECAAEEVPNLPPVLRSWEHRSQSM